MALTLSPCTVKRAMRFVAEHHRRLPKIQGGMWAVAVSQGGGVVGVAIVGHPAQEWTMPIPEILCVLRVAVQDDVRNGCSMLYGACSRAARGMGASDLVTYTHLDEPGTSLRAAGWICGGVTDGGEHDRQSRRRQLALFPEPKIRWFAPWSAMARDLHAEAVA